MATAAPLAVGAYWGLGIAGPSAWPGVIFALALALAAVALAAALWTGFGGRRVAALSLLLGTAIAVLFIVYPLASGAGIAVEQLGGALYGVAIVLCSAVALSGYDSKRSRPQ
ncbi:MAG TPA: hypothetical protein VID95_06855 [Candidatus Limnocylindrales bacterium]